MKKSELLGKENVFAWYETKQGGNKKDSIGEKGEEDEKQREKGYQFMEDPDGGR